MTALRIDILRLRRIVAEEVARALDTAGRPPPGLHQGLAGFIDHTLLRPDATGTDIPGA